jgi:Flp pilus assembly protein TadG
MTCLISVRYKLKRTAQNLCLSLPRFISNQSGNAALTFGLCVFILIMTVGAAIDFSRVITVRKAVQDASDIAVLHAMQFSQGSMTDTEIANLRQSEADTAFAQNFSSPYFFGVTKTLTKESQGTSSQETYHVQGKVTSIFGALFGKDYYLINITSKSQSSMSKTQIAFVLDVTGSMAGDNRMTNLKSSVDSVLSSILVNGTNVSGTEVGIVPFNTQVRIAQGTNLSYVDYGTQDAYESCRNFDWYTCMAAWDTNDKVCISSSTVDSCRAKNRGFYKVVNSGNRIYYYITYKAYDVVNGKYKIYTLNQTFYAEQYTYNNPAGCSAETGACWDASSGTAWSFNFSNRSSNTSTSSNLNSYNSNPSGYTAITSSMMPFDIWNGNGYGANSENRWTQTTYGSTRGYIIPAQSDTKANWTGCVIDRQQSYDVSADAPNSAIPASLYPARPCESNTLKPIQALNDNITAARSFVQSLESGGNTNITIGVQWGMEVLSPTDPMTNTVPWNDESTKKYMIVVTDGLNTQNRFSTNTSDIDARTALACSNAKAKGITIFVVRVMEGNSDLLRACASKSDYFYDLTSASQLNSALSSVFDAIKKLRITQ